MSDLDNGSQAQAHPDMSADGGMGSGLEGSPDGGMDGLGDIPQDIEGNDDEVLSYKEVSEMSEVTQESYPEGYIVSHAATAAVEDLVDFEKLKQQT